MKAYLDAEEVKALEKAATCFRDRLLIRLLFRLGCRVSELLALKVEDIDFTQGTVTIEHLKTRLKLALLAIKFTIGAQVFTIRCYTVKPFLFPAGSAAVIIIGDAHTWRALVMVPTGVELDVVGDSCLIQLFLRQLQNKT